MATFVAFECDGVSYVYRAENISYLKRVIGSDSFIIRFENGSFISFQFRDSEESLMYILM